MAPPYTPVVQQNPQRVAILVLSLASLVLYVGHVIILVAVYSASNGAVVLAGGIMFLVGCALYIPGFIFYRRNSGKPSFVGYVVSSGGPPLQQLAVAYLGNQPAMQYPPMAVPEGPAASFDNPPSYDQTTTLPVKL